MKFICHVTWIISFTFNLNVTLQMGFLYLDYFYIATLRIHDLNIYQILLNLTRDTSIVNLPNINNVSMMLKHIFFSYQGTQVKEQWIPLSIQRLAWETIRTLTISRVKLQTRLEVLFHKWGGAMHDAHVLDINFYQGYTNVQDLSNEMEVNNDGKGKISNSGEGEGALSHSGDKGTTNGCGDNNNETSLTSNNNTNNNNNNTTNSNDNNNINDNNNSSTVITPKEKARQHCMMWVMLTTTFLMDLYMGLAVENGLLAMDEYSYFFYYWDYIASTRAWAIESLTTFKVCILS